jgi:cytochrome c oxidase subunit 1
MNDHAAHAHDDAHDVPFLEDGKGWKSWLFTLDHKRIGVMYLWSVLIAFAAGGVFALLLRLELMAPGKQYIEADTYNRFFTLHGAIMVFLFIIPAIPSAMGNFVLPLMLGAKDVAFPRLNLLSFWIYGVGSIMALSSIVFGGVETGWTFYTPYSTNTSGAVVMMTLSVFVLGFSSILTGLNFIVTIHKMRAPGMSFFRMPLFVWATYATSILQVMATPVLGITLLLLVAERTLGIGIFDPALGGDPVLYQHFFWFYSHPAVYIMILPGMGVISEIITVFSRKTIFGYRAIAYSSLGIAISSFLVWGHHMFLSGQSAYAGMVFSFLTFLVAIPSAIKVFNWTATLYKGSISFDAPMMWTLSFMVLFTIGGLTGLFLGALGVDVHLHDTYFVVAHFHYVMMGGTVIAFYAGLHYWWPKMFGVMYREGPAKFSAIIVFIGFNATFFTQFVLGTRGMPRRYYNYLDQYQPLHQFSTFGSWIIGLGFIVMTVNLLASFKQKVKAPANPWGARTLEWSIPSPPITHNFHKTPVVTEGPYDFPVEGQAASGAEGKHA